MQEVGATLDLEGVLSRLDRLISDAGSAAAFARAKGVSEGQLSEARSLGEKPGPRVLAAVGVEREVVVRYRIVRAEADCRVRQEVPA